MSLAQRSDRWTRYLGDLQAYAALPVPLETEGTLVRVAGLVLEAAGVRVPVGSVCEVRSSGQPAVTAEVVGFSSDRAFLMPTGELLGLASGARVVPLPAPNTPPASAVTTTPGAAAKTAACTCRWARACSAASSTPMVRRWTVPERCWTPRRSR